MSRKTSNRSRTRRTGHHRVADVNTGRGTFDVARVVREVRRTNPGLLYTSPSEKKRLAAESTKTVSAPKAKPVKAALSRKVEKQEKPKEKKLELSQKRACKARPSRTAGNGSSRKFIPYCK